MPSSERGIVYFSSIPNGVNPSNLQVYLTSEYGEVGRIYLTPENEGSAFYSRGSASKFQKRYRDGYIEFMCREDAIFAANHLNLRSCDMLGRRHPSHGQLWNIRYEPELRWETIVENKESIRAAKEKWLKARKKHLRDKNTQYYAQALKRLDSISERFKR